MAILWVPNFMGNVKKDKKSLDVKFNKFGLTISENSEKLKEAIAIKLKPIQELKQTTEVK